MDRGIASGQRNVSENVEQWADGSIWENSPVYREIETTVVRGGSERRSNTRVRKDYERRVRHVAESVAVAEAEAVVTDGHPEAFGGTCNEN